MIRIAPKKKEQQKMSLGAFLTDESKNEILPGLLEQGTDMLQKWAPGLMRWRTCQFVSALSDRC
jgi:hypothetical protein